MEPPRLFDWVQYIHLNDLNPDDIPSREAAWEHWTVKGKKMGFFLPQYISANSPLTSRLAASIPVPPHPVSSLPIPPPPMSSIPVPPPPLLTSSLTRLPIVNNLPNVSGLGIPDKYRLFHLISQSIIQKDKFIHSLELMKDLSRDNPYLNITDYLVYYFTQTGYI